MPSYKIPWDDAKTMIGMYIRKLGPDSIYNHSVGGTISLSSFKSLEVVDIKFKGMMAWFCWNKAKNDFFLAFEYNKSYDPVNEMLTPENTNLQAPHPGNIFTVPQGIDPQIFLDTHRIGSAGADVIIPQATVVQMKNDFVANGPAYPGGKPLNKLPYSFFENEINPDVTRFRAQPNIYAVRYYFGYDPGHQTNEIRVILVPVDKSGQNVIPVPGDAASAATVWALEQSWPPPPPL